MNKDEWVRRRQGGGEVACARGLDGTRRLFADKLDVEHGILVLGRARNELPRHIDRAILVGMRGDVVRDRRYEVVVVGDL